LEVADQLCDLGVLEVSLIGGEAFLHPGFLAIVRRLTDRGVLVAMATGGVGVDAELARAARAAGLASASVSIDGIGRTHDALRGVRHGFEQGLAAARPLKDAGVYVGLNSQIPSITVTSSSRLNR
jgi:MoaA/NifB/PqqE/SkfB family radical SAM enzyme